MSDANEQWLIVKRDLYYGPNDSGYTGIRDLAGRYTYEEAKARENPDSGVTIVRLSEAPEFREAAFEDLVRKHIQKQRDALAEALRGCISYRNWEIAEGGVVPEELRDVWKCAEAVLAKLETSNG